MARIRTIKPEFFRHEQLQDLEIVHPDLRPMLVFAGLWGQCDKNGVFEWKPRQLKLDILPFVGNDMGASLALLRGAKLIRLMYHGKKMYGYIPSFRDHQRITGKEAQAASKFPDPAELTEGHTGETPGEQPGNRTEEGVFPGENKVASGLPAADAPSVAPSVASFRQTAEITAGKCPGSNGDTPENQPGAQEGKGREEERKKAAVRACARDGDGLTDGAEAKGGGEERQRLERLGVRQERMRLSEILELKRSCLATLAENPGQVTILQDICALYPPEVIREAFVAAQVSNVKNLNWVLARLRGKGRASPKGKGGDAQAVEEKNKQALRDFCGVGA